MIELSFAILLCLNKLGARSNVAVNTAERSRLTMEAAIKRVVQSGPSLVAIDGLPCSGKSTMAELLKQRLSASCVQLDEFLLPERDWPADVKPAFPFQNIRYSAFVSAVQALATAGSCSFEPFDALKAKTLDTKLKAHKIKSLFLWPFTFVSQ